jgi:hypothetical protein
MLIGNTMTTPEIPQFKVFGEGDTAPLDLGARQAEVTKRGLGLVTACVQAKSPLLDAELIVASRVAAPGKKRFVSDGPIAGGWHEVQLPNRPGPVLFRLDFEYPEAQKGTGFTEVEIAGRTVSNGVISPGKKDRIRVDIDDRHTGHVSGSHGGSPFHVDHLHAHSASAELGAADTLLTDAQAGIAALLAPPQEVAPTAQQDFVPLFPSPIKQI